MKGLGLRQTYFVQKVCGDNCDVIYLQSDTKKEEATPERRLSSNSLQPSQENTIRNSSFIKLSRCTIVPHPPQSSQPSWPEEVDSSMGSNTESRLEMSRPILSTSNIVPISEEKEPPDSQAFGQNGITSIFISPPPSSTNIITGTSTEQEMTKPPPAGRTQKKKCVIC